MYRVVITGPARRDIQDAHQWWAEHRSAEQAGKWDLGVRAAIQMLRNRPEQSSSVAESDLSAAGIRQRLYGLGRRATHRILFAIDGTDVVVLRVRHTSQDALTLDDVER